MTVLGITGLAERNATSRLRLPRFTLKSAVATLFTLLPFLYFTFYASFGVWASFYTDDIMNLYWAFANVSWEKLLAANIVPFTTVYRPLGALYYRSVFEVTGLNPLGFRLVTYVFLYLNILLLILVVRRLTNSSEIALISALVWCYHRRSVDIWVNNGTVYDVLCFTCVITALLFWIYMRRKPISPRWYHHLTVVLLSVCAINAKEMGVTLPLLLLAYEVIYCLKGKKQGLARWLVRDLGAIWLMLLLMSVAILTKTAEGDKASPFL